MNIQLQYGTAVATVPAAALAVLDRATQDDLKVLLTLCAKPALTTGNSFGECVGNIAAEVGCTPARVEASLSFWRGAGVLNMRDEESVTPPKGTEVKVTASPEVPEEVAAPVAPDGEDNKSDKTIKLHPVSELPRYTSTELANLLEARKETSEYLNECQNIWGKTFNIMEYNLILGLVDYLGLEWDYVITLLSFVVTHFEKQNNEAKSLRYVEKMAFEFYDKGITSSDSLAEEFKKIERMNTFETQIRELFGLGAGRFTPRQKQYLSAWLYEYGYDLEIIEYAYAICVDTKGSPHMGYTNGVLKRWYESGLKTLDEIIANKKKIDAGIQQIVTGNVTPDNCLEVMNNAMQEQNSTVAPSARENYNISQDINILRRLLGLGNRLLTKNEINTFTKWRIDYGFRYEIIYYAYELTVEKTNNYSLSYMDSIITKWYEQKLTNLNEIRAYGKGYKEDKKRKKEKDQNSAYTSTFDTNDFFLDAVRRSFGDDFDPSILNT